MYRYTHASILWMTNRFAHSHFWFHPRGLGLSINMLTPPTLRQDLCLQALTLHLLTSGYLLHCLLPPAAVPKPPAGPLSLRPSLAISLCPSRDASRPSSSTSVWLTETLTLFSEGLDTQRIADLFSLDLHLMLSVMTSR